MYNNEMNNPTFSLNNVRIQGQQQKEKKHNNQDNSHSRSEEHPRSHITTVPFSRTKTGSFQ
jgi:hypothetical protein